MIARLRVYVAGSFPARAYLPYAVAWALGGTAVCALTDTRVSGWLPDAGVAVSTVTLVVVLLLMRSIDDIRDRDYDRRHNPDRPLARGAVTVSDLAVLNVGGVVVVLGLNAWRPPVALTLAGLLGYAYLLLWADRRVGWPAGDAVVPTFLVNFPVQLMVNAYLYAGLLHSTGLRPSWSGAVGIAVSALAFLHFEFARKTTRSPAPGERTYVTVFGTSGTVALAIGCAAVSVALLGTASAGTVGWAAVCLAGAPLAFVALGALRFWRDRAVRWPYGAAASFMLASFVGYQITSVVERAGGS